MHEKTETPPYLLKRVLKALEEEGIETELVQLAGEQIHGCTACRACFETKNQQCTITDDKVNEYIQKMVEADGIILGSPTYFGMMSPEMKALIDRAGFVCRATPEALKYKVGAAVARCPPSRRHDNFRRHKPLFPHQPDDYSRLQLLEHWRRKQKRRRGKRRGGHGNNGNSWQKHGMAS